MSASPDAKRMRVVARHILREHPEIPYAPDAFVFVGEGLRVGSEEIRRAEGQWRHLTGQELCLHLREYARSAYGALARFTLNQWGLRTTRDFGEIVYLLIAAGYFSATEEDRIEDFDDVYDFESAFHFPWGAPPA